MRLYVDIVGFKQLFCAIDRQLLGHIHKLTASVIPLAWVALGIFIGEHATLRLEHSGARIVFRSDQLDMLLLAAALILDGLGQLRIESGDSVFHAKHSRSLERRCGPVI